jgi:hypothetical protein
MAFVDLTGEWWTTEDGALSHWVGLHHPIESDSGSSLRAIAASQMLQQMAMDPAATSVKDSVAAMLMSHPLLRMVLVALDVAGRSDMARLMHTHTGKPARQPAIFHTDSVDSNMSDMSASSPSPARGDTAADNVIPGVPLDAVLPRLTDMSTQFFLELRQVQSDARKLAQFVQRMETILCLFCVLI